jgi:transposase
MLGPAKPRRLDQPITVSLEDLVPTDHFYRHLEAKLDLSFIRDWTRELYADRGRPSIDPVVFFKLQLVMFFEGIRSERKLIETASLNLAHRWYLGYALDEDLPDHSSLTRIRQRLGVAIFERFFERIVDLCQEVGLVWGRELYFDATRVRADADTDSLVPRFYADAQAHVADIFADQLEPHDELAAPPAECTESRRGRIIHRVLYAEYLDKVRGYHATQAYKKAMRKRQVWVKPLFAEAKVWHGLCRFRRRGLRNVTIEGLLIAAGQNLKRWLVATGWGRRHAPCGSLVALPRETWRIAVVSG